MVTSRNLHLPVFQPHPLTVSFGKGRQNLFDSQVARFVDDQIKGFFVKFRKLFMLRQFLDIELFVENKINIPSIGYYLCHGISPLLRQVYLAS